MYQRRVRPYEYRLPTVTPQQSSGYYQPGSVSQTEGEKQQQQQMPNIPTGLLKEMLKPSPYSMGSELPTGAGLMNSYIGGLGPSSAYAGAAADVAPNLGFSTPYLDSLAGGYESLMPASEAFSLGMGEGALAAGGTETAGLLGSGAAAGGEAAGASAASSAGMMGPWAPITLAAMLAKSQVQGSDPSSPAGVLDTLLLPSIDQWMANPGRSLANTFDAPGTALGDVTGMGDETWFNMLMPGGLFGLFK